MSAHEKYINSQKHLRDLGSVAAFSCGVNSTSYVTLDLLGCRTGSMNETLK